MRKISDFFLLTHRHLKLKGVMKERMLDTYVKNKRGKLLSLAMIKL